VNKIISVEQQDTFSMIAKKSQASDTTFFHLSFWTIYGGVFREMLDIKFENSYSDYRRFFDNLVVALPAHHPNLLLSFPLLDQ